MYNPDFRKISNNCPAFKFPKAAKFSNESPTKRWNSEENQSSGQNYLRKKDDLYFEREFARIMKTIKRKNLKKFKLLEKFNLGEVNTINPFKKQAEDLDVKIFDQNFLPAFHKTMAKSFKSAKDSLNKIKKGVMGGLEDFRKENFNQLK